MNEAPLFVLGVFPEAEDRSVLAGVLTGPQFNLHMTESLEQTSSLLGRQRFDLIVTDGNLSESRSWRHLFAAVQQIAPTPIIVVDRLADERLWAEVLNMGCYDLLMKPMRAAELLRVVSEAEQYARRSSGAQAAKQVA